MPHGNREKWVELGFYLSEDMSLSLKGLSSNAFFSGRPTASLRLLELIFFQKFLISFQQYPDFSVSQKSPHAFFDPFGVVICWPFCCGISDRIASLKSLSLSEK